MPPTRRSLLATLFGATALPFAHRSGLAAQPPAMTPACDDGDAATLSSSEGPFFKPDAPLRQDFTGDAANGEPIALAGYVMDGRCRPLANAVVQLWHADADGRYDNRGNRFRGYQRTDQAGRWWFTTIVPALYPGRTRHYHVKVQQPSGARLTTQLYFPDEPGNARDWLHDDRLNMRLTAGGTGRLARFDFVV